MPNLISYIRPVRRCTRCFGIVAKGPERYYTQVADAVKEDDSAPHFSAFPHDTPPDDGSIQHPAPPINPGSFTTKNIVHFPPPLLIDRREKPKEQWVKRRTGAEALALFDACLHTKNWARAEALLKQVRSLSDDTTTLHALNNWLSVLVAEAVHCSDATAVQKHFDSYSEVWKVDPDNVAYASLCRAILSTKDTASKAQKIKGIVRAWRRDHADFGEVLTAPGVLSSTEQREIFSLTELDYRLIGLQHRENLLDRQHPLQDVIQVSPTPQKGVGLKVLKRSLEAMTNPEAHFEVNKADYNLGGDTLAFNLARQRAIEENAIDAAMLRWKHEHDEMKKRGGLSYKKSLNTMFWEWKEEMLPLIHEELARVDHRAADRQIPRVAEGRRVRYKREDHLPDFDLAQTEKEADYLVLKKSLEEADILRSRRDYGPFIGLLKPDKLAAITILEVIRSLTTETLDGLKATTLAVKIGKALEDEYHSEVLKKKSTSELFKINYREAVQSGRVFNMSVRKAQAHALKIQDSGLFLPDWTQSVRAQLGALMLSFLIYAARLTLSKTDVDGTTHTQEVPAFFHTYQYNRGQKLGVVKVQEDMIAKLSSEPLRGSIYPRLLPMLTPPRPWYSYNSGGYLLSRTHAMRSKNAPEQTKYIRQASDAGYLDDIFAGLDVLGQTPWKINHQVFECAVIGWNSGEAIADIPPAESSVLNDLPEAPPTNADPALRYEYMTKLKDISAIARNFASMRSDLNYKLEIARAFLHDTMYFPHSLDFRGRAYPVPPHFNHLGNDLCRGLLKFADHKALGKHGLRWLKIHLANQCGHDKASFEEREAFADANVEKIFEAADNPMNGTRWWLSVEKPWQCLAACFELADALRLDDPTQFMSSLPVHQDGTCNGLQHYAALGGDLQGAKAVNLEPSDRPQDVYKGVAKIVQESIRSDADLGVEHANDLIDKVTRKVVKQTVMTNVYGVTFVGARKQVENQLSNATTFGERKVWNMSSYLVKKIFAALKTMFTGAHEIQDWLKQTAVIITRSVTLEALMEANNDTMTSVIWTSPLNLPIVQPYRKEVRKQVFTNLQTVFISDPSDAAEVNSRKQSTAFPPNFIHSLDATHMLMSALASRQQGITFAAVHDSYWTHAADTDTMNVILRDAFIKLHSQDLMARLKSEFEGRYKDHYSSTHDIVVGSPAYEYLTSHITTGKVKVLPKSKGLIIIDHDLVAEVHKIKSRDGRTHRAQWKRDEEEKTGRPNYAHIWFPIAFPELPQRGDFDVSRLRGSKYFFS